MRAIKNTVDHRKKSDYVFPIRLLFQIKSLLYFINNNSNNVTPYTLLNLDFYFLGLFLLKATVKILKMDLVCLVEGQEFNNGRVLNGLL